MFTLVVGCRQRRFVIAPLTSHQGDPFIHCVDAEAKLGVAIAQAQFLYDLLARATSRVLYGVAPLRSIALRSSGVEDTIIIYQRPAIDTKPLRGDGLRDHGARANVNVVGNSVPIVVVYVADLLGGESTVVDANFVDETFEVQRRF